MLPFILTNNQLSIIINNKPHIINNTHIHYSAILDELKGEQDPDVLLQLIDIPTTLVDWFGTNALHIDLINETISFNGVEIHSVLVDRIIEMYKDGFNVKPMIAFLENLYQNPSTRAINELYGFLEYGKLPITEDGYFLAYKRVNNDYTSVHDGITKNNIGLTVSMPRDKVNPDSSQTCSSGLHLCSHEYLNNYSGSRILILKVNPRDVVSIPNDYNDTKARACQYEIIGELTETEKETAKKQPVLPQVVADIKSYELTQPNIDVHEEVVKEPVADVAELYSNLFRYAYTNGYGDGRGKYQFDSLIVNPGKEQICGKTIRLTKKDANDVNAGYEQGYKDGKNHNKRLVAKLTDPFPIK